MHKCEIIVACCILALIWCMPDWLVNLLPNCPICFYTPVTFSLNRFTQFLPAQRSYMLPLQ